MTPAASAAVLAELHDELRDVTRRLVGRPTSALGSAVPPALDWAGLASAGLLGLEVPDELGGAGATFAEVAVVLHELGRSPATGPYLGTVVLGVGALLLVERGPRCDELLRSVAAGEATVAVALPGDAAPAAPRAPARSAPSPVGSTPSVGAAVPFRLERTGDRPLLHGHAELVPDAPGVDRLLVPAQGEDGEPVLVDLPADAPGLGVAERPVLDATRLLGDVVSEGVPVDAGSVWRFRGDPGAALAVLWDRAATAAACDSLGLAEAMLETTVAYAAVREQFGRPIGSFQAVQHACADMLVSVTVGRELVAAAVDALAGTGPVTDAGVAASMAKSQVCASAVDVAGKAMQLHGGIGYSWESGVHAYLKRAALDRSLFGSPADHRRRLAARYRDSAAPDGGH